MPAIVPRSLSVATVLRSGAEFTIWAFTAALAVAAVLVALAGVGVIGPLPGEGTSLPGKLGAAWMVAFVLSMGVYAATAPSQGVKA